MIQHTPGIILRTVKYGETSVILTVFTELFGIQSYLVNGVRKEGKMSSKTAMYQPAAILELNVYHNELKNLQRIKEAKWQHLYRHLYSDIIKNAVAMYMVELLQKTLKQPESNPDLFSFVEDAFINLDEAAPGVTANYPIYFALHLAHFFGFRLHDNYSEQRQILDLQNGSFTTQPPSHMQYTHEEYSFIISQFLKAQRPEELLEIKLSKHVRREILLALQSYYGFHIPEFGHLKTLPILQAIVAD